MSRLRLDDLTCRSTPLGDQWVGTVPLPPLACFRDGWARDGAELEDTRPQQARAGIFPLIIPGHSYSGLPGVSARNQPSEEQFSAYEHLTDEASSVRHAVCAATADYLRTLDDSEQLPGVPPTLLERLSRPESVPEVLQLESVHILVEHASGIALVGLEFRSTFVDEEHGFVALMHRSRALTVGAVEAVFRLPPYWKERYGLP